MPILVRNLRSDLDDTDQQLLERVAKRLRISVDAIRVYAVVRRSLDARRKDDVHFSCQIELDLEESGYQQRLRIDRLARGDTVWLQPTFAETVEPGAAPLRERPVIVGFGPGGMFAALRLAQLGYQPIVLERGRQVRERHHDVIKRFYQDHDFDPQSNLLFGEGGAGTYSDGKLYTRINDRLCREVLEVFFQHGADPDILVDARPHIGSDRLPTICSRIREKIESLGGEIRFESQVDDVEIVDGRLLKLRIREAKGSDARWQPAGPTILAIGHSARDTIRMLASRGVCIQPKPFQIGVRIEHPQEMVDHWQYGSRAGHERLGPAEYHLVAKKAAGLHGDLFSFCMCPGGMILPTNESPGLIATNGASRARRSSPFGNSGLVISMQPSDVCPAGIDNLALAAMEFLERFEKQAYLATGETYAVPAQRANDFLAQRSSNGELTTSYPLGGQWESIGALIPVAVSQALLHALPLLDQKYPGFAGEHGLITAPETRASSPIRIVRDAESRQATGVSNLYPVGEGAGYAGGIVSAAVDGLKSAEAIIRHYAPIG